MSNSQKAVFNDLALVGDAGAYYANKNLIVDIGFGNGQHLLSCCAAMPSYNFIGIELYKKGIAGCLTNIKQKKLTNISIIYGEATAALKQLFANNSLAKIQILFPDPWPKRRHSSRRLIQPGFINTIRHKLIQPGGVLHIATDCCKYADHIQQVMSNVPMLQPTPAKLTDLNRMTTKFESRGIKAGRRIYDLFFVLQF